MAISDAVLQETKRKALAGIALSKPTDEKNAIYNSYKPQEPKFDQQAYMKQQQDSVNSMYDKMQQAQTEAFNAKRDQAIGDINYQKQKVAPQYQGLRNQTDVVNMQNSKRLQEMMAARGLGSSGENVTATVAQNNARQHSLNDLNTQEQGTLNDFDHQITNLNNPAELNALLAQLGAQRAQALMDASNRADDVGYQRSRDAIGDQRYADETTYNHGRDTVADNQWQSQFDYNKNTDDRNYNYQVGRDKVADSQWNDQFSYQKDRDKVSDSQWQKQYDADQSQFGQQYALQKLQFELDKKIKNGQLSLDQAQFEFARAQAKKGSSGGGGGGSSRSSGGSSKSSQAKNSLSKEYEQYQAEKKASSKTPLSNYYKQQEDSLRSKLQGPYRMPTGLSPVAPANNKNLTDWERMKLMGL